MNTFLDRLKAGLGKTRQGLVDGIRRVVTGQVKIDGKMVEQLEEILIGADLGVDTSQELMDALRRRIAIGQASSIEHVLACLREEIQQRLASENGNEARDFFLPLRKPLVIMMVGVNGVGKTTTIAKLANQFARRGRSVLVAAADTFRAAAAEQLDVWAKRNEVDIVRSQPGADPAAVAHDAARAVLARMHDVLIVDTAGRLHTKSHLMEEMKKIQRILRRELPEASHEVLLVLDAGTGQNGLAQAQEFARAVDVTGLVITKLDGTAKGGIVVSIRKALPIPIRFIGIGEGINDLQPFDAEAFAEALVGAR
jgi:fused signal recognition particle receptor